MFKLSLGEGDDGKLSNAMSQKLGRLLALFEQQYPDPKQPISPEQKKYVGAGMAAVALCHAIGTVHTMFLCPGEDNKEALEMNFIQGFSPGTAAAVQKDLLAAVQSRGFVVFIDEVYYVGLNKQEFEAELEKAQLMAAGDVKTLHDHAKKKEGLLVRLMTKDFELAYLNPIINKQMTEWRVFLDTRDTSYKALPLDIPLSIGQVHKEMTNEETTGDDQSFAM